jgi:hypothetical protein
MFRNFCGFKITPNHQFQQFHGGSSTGSDIIVGLAISLWWISISYLVKILISMLESALILY